jgi:aspartate aminotransferase
MAPAPGLSPNLQHLETSATIAISQEAKRRKATGEDVIDLGAGEPDFPTPSIPADAGARAIREGKTHYPANEGILELRAAAAKHLSLLSGGRAVNADNIVVSTGSKQSLFNVCFALFGPGDVVAIPAPAWVSYPQIVHLARARPVLVPGDPEWSLKVSVRDLDRVVPGACGLILCSPCNPTGAVYTHGELKAIAQWARDRKVWVIADEIYRRIHYGTGAAPSFLDLPDDLLERVVVVYGVSKTYAMTGWRIGVAVGPRPRCSRTRPRGPTIRRRWRLRRRSPTSAWNKTSSAWWSSSADAATSWSGGSGKTSPAWSSSIPSGPSTSSSASTRSGASALRSSAPA